MACKIRVALAGDLLLDDNTISLGNPIQGREGSWWGHSDEGTSAQFGHKFPTIMNSHSH